MPLRYLIACDPLFHHAQDVAGELNGWDVEIVAIHARIGTLVVIASADMFARLKELPGVITITVLTSQSESQA